MRWRFPEPNVSSTEQAYVIYPRIENTPYGSILVIWDNPYPVRLARCSEHNGKREIEIQPIKGDNEKTMLLKYFTSHHPYPNDPRKYDFIPDVSAEYERLTDEEIREKLKLCRDRKGRWLFVPEFNRFLGKPLSQPVYTRLEKEGKIVILREKRGTRETRTCMLPDYEIEGKVAINF